MDVFTWTLFFEQSLNGLQLGILLFLLAAGLTLVFGIMDLVNLAHGSLYMMGAYFAATFVKVTGSFWIGILLAIPAAMLLGIAIELIAVRWLYQRHHLDQVLGTFGLLLFFDEFVRLVWGPAGLDVPLPELLTTNVEIIPGVPYPTYRIAIIVVGALVALGLYLLVAKTRVGMLIRAGASNREMVRALGVNVGLLFTVIFALGAAMAALAGMMEAPVKGAEIGMGNNVLIVAFVVVVIGGIGSVKGALIAALLVGIIDTMGRAFLPQIMELAFSQQVASTAAPAISSMMIYVLMAIILALKPQGLFPPKTS